jgi:hypothetical protein
MDASFYKFRAGNWSVGPTAICWSSSWLRELNSARFLVDLFTPFKTSCLCFKVRIYNERFLSKAITTGIERENDVQISGGGVFA